MTDRDAVPESHYVWCTSPHPANVPCDPNAVPDAQRTEAGKALLAMLRRIENVRFSSVSFPDAEQDILAIEAEARQSDLSVAWKEITVLRGSLRNIQRLAYREGLDEAAQNDPENLIATIQIEADRALADQLKVSKQVDEVRRFLDGTLPMNRAETAYDRSKEGDTDA